MDAFKPLLAKVAAGNRLSEAEAAAAFDLIFKGAVTPAQLGGFLLALRARGETVEELTGAVSAMRAQMMRVEAPPGAIDIVGTGGDARGTFNISTLAALIVAACGVPVAKHGNHAASSKSGSSDVLRALGAGLDLAPREVESCLSEANIGFMAARRYHAAMRHAAQVRTVLGVFAREWLGPLALVLRNLGLKRAWVLHGSDGLDEATTTGPTFVTALNGGKISAFEITHEQAGLPRDCAADLVGGDPAANAAALREVLGGAKNAYRNIGVFNAAIALVVAGKAESLKEGAALAAAALDEGRAGETLAKFIKASNRALTGAARAAPAL